jgi:hypothetical protein
MRWNGAHPAYIASYNDRYRLSMTLSMRRVTARTDSVSRERHSAVRNRDVAAGDVHAGLAGRRSESNASASDLYKLSSDQ